MSKKQRLVEYSFRPAPILAMRDAFQMACKAPGVADGAPNVTEGVARRILELAKAGETSPDLASTSEFQAPPARSIFSATLGGMLSRQFVADASGPAGRCGYA